MHTYTARELPRVGALIVTTTGARYLVGEAIAETREHGDSARGFVMGRRVVDGETTTTRRTRVYGGEILRETDPTIADPRPLLDPPDGYVALPAHEIDPASETCRHCAAPAEAETYAEYLEHWFRYEYEGEPSHGPRSEERHAYLVGTCSADYRLPGARPAIEAVFDAVVDNYPIGRDTYYIDLAERTGLDGFAVSAAVSRLVELERVELVEIPGERFPSIIRA